MNKTTAKNLYTELMCIIRIREESFMDAITFNTVLLSTHDFFEWFKTNKPLTWKRFVKTHTSECVFEIENDILAQSEFGEFFIEAIELLVGRDYYCDLNELHTEIDVRKEYPFVTFDTGGERFKDMDSDAVYSMYEMVFDEMACEILAEWASEDESRVCEVERVCN